MKPHQLRDGREVDLSSLTPAEQLYLAWLRARIEAGEVYEAVAPAVGGPGAYPLFAQAKVHDVALDLLARMPDAPPQKGRNRASTTGLLTVTEAAARLGISRVAVIKAIREDRLPAFRFD
jgi:hypothetical protein